MTSRLVAIREQLDRLRALDPTRRVFGARPRAGHDYRERPRLDHQGIAKLEREYGAPFPHELRLFLEQVHGGGPGPGYGFDVWGESPRAGKPFPFGKAQLEQLLERQARDPRASLPMVDEDDEDACWPPGPGFHALSHHGCGVYDVIVVTGEFTGSIWCCDMAWRPHLRDGRLLTFLDWYENWLTWNLTPASVGRLSGREPNGV